MNIEQQRTAVEADRKEPDDIIELPKPFMTVYDDVDKVEVGCYSEIQVRAAIEADRQERHLKEKAQLEQERSDLKRMQAQYEADRKRIDVLDNVARSSRSVDQLKEALQDRSQRFTASYSEVMNLIGFYESNLKRRGDLIPAYQAKVRTLEAENYALISGVDDRQRRGEPVNTDAAGYTKGPVSNGGMDPRNTPVEPIPSMPAEPVKVPSHETIRLVGVIANKIEDGTLFNGGIFSRKELAEKVREVLIFAAQPELKSIPNGAMLYTTPQPAEPAKYECIAAWTKSGIESLCISLDIQQGQTGGGSKACAIAASLLRGIADQHFTETEDQHPDDAHDARSVTRPQG